MAATIFNKEVSIQPNTEKSSGCQRQALGQNACRQGITIRYIQLPKLLDTLKMARSYGVEKFSKVRKHFTEIQLLILDEWLMFKIDETECKDLLHIMDRTDADSGSSGSDHRSADGWRIHAYD